MAARERTDFTGGSCVNRLDFMELSELLKIVSLLEEASLVLR